jgi:hypothetical protein
MHGTIKRIVRENWTDAHRELYSMVSFLIYF